ncbi:predicted protein [Streptomyces viridosporus ATCC 14672]|uniref:Predicted protein n=1 Tax=Streptomyces viridosporus (strain ATCC 14672 / DSM 40746 / JCM 4963 / KCTC 9882 / NRRL B-12104 / FH 1290) TaxID=566461 RepID=D6A2J6_STRV1|nr:predicted protein [Streptomyces viridosporus ATCC 14672]
MPLLRLFSASSPLLSGPPPPDGAAGGPRQPGRAERADMKLRRVFAPTEDDPS